MKKTFASALALLVWFALLLQLASSVRLGIARGFGVGYGLWMYVAFFTVTTNALVAVTLSVPLVAPASRLGQFLARPASITGVTASIIMVGVVYSVLLRHAWNPRGWQLLADTLLHDIVPVLMVAYWWLAVPRRSIPWREVTLWAIYPIVYFVYAMARGTASGFYPYPFLNVSTIGFGMVILNALACLLGFFAIVAVLLAIKSSFRAAEAQGTAASPSR